MLHSRRRIDGWAINVEWTFDRSPRCASELFLASRGQPSNAAHVTRSAAPATSR